MLDPAREWRDDGRDGKREAAYCEQWRRQKKVARH